MSKQASKQITRIAACTHLDEVSKLFCSDFLLLLDDDDDGSLDVGRACVTLLLEEVEEVMVEDGRRARVGKSGVTLGASFLRICVDSHLSILGLAELN